VLAHTRLGINSQANSESPLKWTGRFCVLAHTRLGINSQANSESPLKWTGRFSIQSSSEDFRY
ncbi:hypothetical protein, partial [Argonema antarcticum]|uniref:hypothetical protein n=1 Tax=Argonema antarcticum TaxID=2942763 RepID=UPI002010D426